MLAFPALLSQAQGLPSTPTSPAYSTQRRCAGIPSLVLSSLASVTWHFSSFFLLNPRFVFFTNSASSSSLLN